MKNYAFAVAVATVVMAVSAPLAARPMQCPAATPAAVEAQFAKFSDAWATKNPDTVTALFSKNAVLLATVSNKPRTEPGMIRDYFVAFLKNSPVGTIDTSTVKVDCRTASRVGTWTVKLTSPTDGKVTDVKARYSFIYTYEGGKWMIDHLHSSAMPEVIATH